MSYGDLTEAERAFWDEYTCLRSLTNWPGFDPVLKQAKEDCREWLLKRRDEIKALAEGKVPNQKAGWSVANRRARYDFLAPANLNVGKPKHEVRLPSPGVCTNAEKVYLEAREVYLTFASQTPAQKARKLANVDWLVKRRQDLWHLMKDDDPTPGRKRRYDALCIATHHGSAYNEWAKAHNKWGVPHTAKPKGGREFAVAHARSFIGVTEHPANSNSGQPQPSKWQERVYGDDGVPWCACFTTCMAWDAGVKGSATASVAANMDLARKGQGIYRGLTTDPSRVNPGDHAVIGCGSCHIEQVDKNPTPDYTDTVGGNTAPKPGSGSEYNGGCVASRRRARREIVCYLLVRFG